MNKRRREEREARRDTDRKHLNRDDRRSIYVGNLPYDIRKEELRALCSNYGDVFDVTLGARGFGFVFMDAKGARRALTALDKRTFGGRILHVNEAFKEER
jgi:RNA recognition motif-containing protein